MEPTGLGGRRISTLYCSRNLLAGSIDAVRHASVRRIYDLSSIGRWQSDCHRASEPDMNSLNILKRAVRLDRLRSFVDRKPAVLLTLVCLLVFGVQGAAASDISARSCADSDVQTAINSSSTGDKVVVPAGTCTWTATVSIGKDITLQGAGQTSTIITMSAGRLELGNTASRVTGFSFTITGTGAPSIIVAEGQNWRVDHNRLEVIGGQFGNGVFAFGARVGRHPTGVVDHNQVVNARVLI